MSTTGEPNCLIESPKTGAQLGGNNSQSRLLFCVLGCPVDSISSADAIAKISAWATNRESRYVCICNAHMTVTAARDVELNLALKEADLVTPDGAPVAWMLRRLGARKQRRVSGPDLMLAYCEHAAATGQGIYLYGSTEKTLAALEYRLCLKWPSLRIVGRKSPPFRPLNDDERNETIKHINQSGANIVWVGLGCPKQEHWMHQNRGRINAVMLGVGAAFSFHAGMTTRAPKWMQNNGLEWLHRLAMEPRRLGKRYLKTNIVFIIRAFRQLRN